jgi:hypothetical protein
VRFVTAELWGREAESGEIIADLWESYLEATAPSLGGDR